MALVLVATAGAANANSFLTVAEADTYFEGRLPLSTPWEDNENKAASLVMATRILSAMAQAHRSLKIGMTYIHETNAYYYTSRAWTGTVSTTTQALAWPRTGMLDANGNAIGVSVIPQALKDATAELAGQLSITDTTLDNDISVAGITSVKAGSVAVTFKDMIERHVLPDIVLSLMPPSWFTDELYEPAMLAQLDVISS